MTLTDFAPRSLSYRELVYELAPNIFDMGYTIIELLPVTEYTVWRRKLLVNIKDWLDQGGIEFYARAIVGEGAILGR